MSVQRYLEGTAYIVYGPGPPTDTITNFHHDRDQSHGNCGHRHAELQSQSHFWVVFRPDREVEQIHLHLQQPHHQDHHHKQQDSALNNNNNESRFFVLKGTPHPWGSYPSDMPPPHGCIPPHLYYHVTMSEYGNDHSDHDYHYSETLEVPSLPSTCPIERSVTGVEGDKNDSRPEVKASTKDISPLNEWTIPFVHRIGDGKDDAGGLTSAYSLLQDLEDADDYGAFLEHKLQRSQPCDSTPSLYASTQVLISERRALQVLEQNVFISSETTEVPRVTLLRELQSLVANHVKETTAAASSLCQLPFCVLRSDLKLIVPVAKV